MSYRQKVKAVLARIEWNGATHACSICGNLDPSYLDLQDEKTRTFYSKWRGHESNCELAALLKESEQEDVEITAAKAEAWDEGQDAEMRFVMMVDMLEMPSPCHWKPECPPPMKPSNPYRKQIPQHEDHEHPMGGLG